MTAETIGTSADRQFRVWYLGGHFGWMCSWGLLKVIYVYLITIELGESPERVGFASRAPLRIRDLTEDDWLNGLWPSAAMLAPEFPGVSRAPIELSPLQDRAQAISYSEYCHTAAARRSSWTRRRML